MRGLRKDQGMKMRTCGYKCAHACNMCGSGGIQQLMMAYKDA